MKANEKVLKLLENVKDPEIPVLNVVEMGIVRGVEVEADSIRVEITPTYSGCPAMQVIRDEIAEVLQAHGWNDVSIRQIYSPAWTTDWMTADAKSKLKEYGISPPAATTGKEFVPLVIDVEPVPCPFCDSEETELRSAFGSTACKEFHFCRSCHQPFEAFKAI